MRAEFRRSFVKDIAGTHEVSVRRRVAEAIERVEAADRIEDVANVRRLNADGPYYRLRVGDYRLGLRIDDNCVVFVRLLHRRDIYRYFP